MMNDYNTKVTVELRELVENGVDIWAFDYPSYYKGDDKKAFEQKVIDHYYFRQIGQETTGRFLHYFRARMREIMPYYIQLYESVDLYKSIDDPLESYNLVEEYTRDTTNTGNVTSSGSSTVEGDSTEDVTVGRERRFSNTPQGSIDNLDNYMTEATCEDETTGGSRNTTESSESSTSSEHSDTGSETYRLTRRGNIGVQPLGQELKVLRESFLNIDMMIIKDLNDLFLKVY